LMSIKEKNYRPLDDEEWREVPGSNNVYWVSNYGRVKSFYYKKKDGAVLKSCNLNNFKYVNIKTNGPHKVHLVHKLVALAWLERPTENHTVVTHLDRNLKNNHFSNLQWLTPEESRKRNGEYYKKIFTGQIHPDERHHTKLKVNDVIQLKKMLLRGIPQSKIAKMFCISEMQVTRIKRGENWGDVKIPEKKK